MKNILIILLITILTMPVAAFPRDNSLDEIAKAMLKEGMAHPKSYEMLSELTSIGSRLSGSENYERAVQWGKSKMLSLGFQNVHLQPVKVPHWVRGEVQFAEAKSSSGKKLDLTICALGGSIATPPGGITAEVIEVHSL
ncbi:MAG TPA: peptidase M28 family protein, partial [Acidobacteriota bacterium]|nr:peptidase M28 family protein [Acidobacteriota bacterium]